MLAYSPQPIDLPLADHSLFGCNVPSEAPCDTFSVKESVYFDCLPAQAMLTINEILPVRNAMGAIARTLYSGPVPARLMLEALTNHQASGKQYEILACAPGHDTFECRLIAYGHRPYRAGHSYQPQPRPDLVFSGWYIEHPDTGDVETLFDSHLSIDLDPRAPSERYPSA
ncbi:hypothetical protein VRRI112168_14960 [Vreelandella rituensis]|uniref:Uncharacterized protein n=1 Tax=Vreelandella rituensis TaxID=2282306 RepID=A0A368UB35_9GAMM|nr:hypothetical protein [Halomonas rituensis]RCV93777.1 hypothetical protein DU506_01070 [Halomonas rituensis]